MTKKLTPAQRITRILDTLENLFPNPRPGLEYRNPWEMLVATVLSAQCTDARVNMVTPKLFARWSTPKDLMNADPAELKEVVRSIGLFENKSKNLLALSRIVVEKFGGVVPPDREALESLPGVGRKTASVVLSQAFDIPAFAVDTHVGRVSMRLGFCDTKDPVKVEKAMTAIIPPKRKKTAHLTLIRHGRNICKAAKPLCGVCPVNELCPWPGKTG